MVPFVVVVLHELADGDTQGMFADENESIQTRFLDRPHEALGVRIGQRHISTCNGQAGTRRALFDLSYGRVGSIVDVCVLSLSSLPFVGAAATSRTDGSSSLVRGANCRPSAFI
jgi:hypothetical protein